ANFSSSPGPTLRMPSLSCTRTTTAVPSGSLSSNTTFPFRIVPLVISMAISYGTGCERRIRMVCYAIIIEKGEGNYGAYVPDLPGCVAVGDTLDETRREIAEAIAFHLEGMRADGEVIPEPTTRVAYVDVAS